MSTKPELGKYSFGVGDRFAHQAKAQLKAIIMAKEKGVAITPVWNKSYREHQTIGSDTVATREQADLAVQGLGWRDSYLLDADHINLTNVDFFMDTCDFSATFCIKFSEISKDVSNPGNTKVPQYFLCFFWKFLTSSSFAGFPI